MLLTREQFHLKFIQVNLQGGQSIFTRQAAPTDSFQFDRTDSRSVDRILFVLTAPDGLKRGHCQSRA